jgi:hypothetical protein
MQACQDASSENVASQTAQFSKVQHLLLADRKALKTLEFQTHCRRVCTILLVYAASRFKQRGREVDWNQLGGRQH